MTLLESINKTQVVFLPTFNKDSNDNVEIEIEGYLLKGNVDIKGNYNSNGSFYLEDFNFELTSQEFTLLSVYDTELCCDISFTKKESDAVNEWFKKLEINVEYN